MFDTSKIKSSAVAALIAMAALFSHPNFGIPKSIAPDNAGSLFYNFQENSGGRPTISMGLRLSF
jgi:hypothetical protein